MVAAFTAEDIPGENNCGRSSTTTVPRARGGQLPGQPVAVVVAREMVYAREAATKARLNIQPLGPILTIEDALATPRAG